MRKRGHGLLVCLCGAALVLWGAALLWNTPAAMIYVVSAPDVTTEGHELGSLCTQAQERLDEVTALNETQRGSVAARMQHRELNADNAALSATVYAVGAGYFENHYERLLCGRLVSEADISLAQRVIVLDESAALVLFSENEPLGRTLLLDGTSYEVSGVIRGSRRVGEADGYVAYIPLTTADQLAMQPDTVELTAPARENMGQSILLRDTLKAWRTDGSFYDLAKEKLRATMSLRLLALFSGIALLLVLVNRWNIRNWNRVRFYIVELRTRYVRSLLPAMIRSAICAVLGYAALIGLGFLLARLFTDPLTVFPEWVPEVIVEIRSLQMCFWSLANESSAAVRFLCRDACRVELAGGLILWGTLTVSIGLLLHHVPFLTRYIKATPLPKRYEGG